MNRYGLFQRGERVSPEGCALIAAGMRRYYAAHPDRRVTAASLKDRQRHEAFLREVEQQLAEVRRRLKPS